MKLKEYEIDIKFKLATYESYDSTQMFNMFRNAIYNAVHHTSKNNNLITSEFQFKTRGEK